MPVARTGSSPRGQGQAQPLLYTEYGVSLHSSNRRLRTDTGRAQRCPIVYSRQGRGKPSPYYIRNIAACAPVPGRAQRCPIVYSRGTPCGCPEPGGCPEPRGCFQPPRGTPDWCGHRTCGCPEPGAAPETRADPWTGAWWYSGGREPAGGPPTPRSTHSWGGGPL